MPRTHRNRDHVKQVVAVRLDKGELADLDLLVERLRNEKRRSWLTRSDAIREAIGRALAA